MKNTQSKQGFAPIILVGIVALALLLGGGTFYFFRSAEPSDDELSKDADMMMPVLGTSGVDEHIVMPDGGDSMMDEGDSTMDSGDMMMSETKTFKITGQNFRFLQNEIRVKMGDRVRIEFESTGGFHDFVIDKFNAKTSQVNTGGKASVEFVADTTGEFEFYCSVGQHRQMGMKGKLIVEPAPSASIPFSGAKLAGNVSPLLDFVKADYNKARASEKLIVLYFYANWCPICREEFPKMQSAFNELTTDGVIAFRVNYNDNETDDVERDLAREFGVAYQHTKVFVKNGARVGKYPDGWSKDRYLSEINKFLNQ